MDRILNVRQNMEIVEYRKQRSKTTEDRAAECSDGRSSHAEVNSVAIIECAQAIGRMPLRRSVGTKEENMEKQLVLQGLNRQQKEIPFSSLYDTEGSNPFEDITGLEEYYLYNAELGLFEENGVDIAEAISPQSLFVELGCGSAKKTASLLNAIQHVHGRFRYVGIDVSQAALDEAYKNLLDLVPGLKASAIELVRADFLEGLQQVKSCHPQQPLCIAWLGSSVGNLTRENVVEFFSGVMKVVGSACQLLICMDMWKNPQTLYSAYHDKEGVTERFIKHGMQNALSCIGYAADEESMESWRYEVEVNHILRRVEMYITFTQGLFLDKHQIRIRPGERILVEFSSKYNVSDIKYIATKSSCQVYRFWGDASFYTCQMLVPASHALAECWRDTDKLFQGISDWNSKPIDLRHPYLFYYAHVCAFTKLKIIENHEDEEFQLDTMFSRGIDPNVLDPSQCHSHPSVPPTWPPKEAVINYVKRTRLIIENEVSKGKVNTRLISLALEHERMHQETLTYMLVQDRKIAFEKSFPPKQNGHYQNGHDKNCTPKHNLCRPDILIEAGEVELGVNPGDITTFTWDNEGPSFHTKISEPFLVSAKAVSVKDFLSFIINGGYKNRSLWREDDFTFFLEEGLKHPATWSLVGTEYYIHGVDSSKHWTEVAEDAVYVSLAEAEAFSKWMGCRIMTEAEYHRVLHYDNHTKMSTDDNQHCQKPSLENSMDNKTQGGNLKKHKMKDIRGGGWEWTSSEFYPFPGFKAMAEYEEYSTDFFDGKHYVLKGWSDATHESMHRDSFRNFYQRQYRYVFSKFRCCSSLV